MTVALEVAEIYKNFGGLTAVNNVSFKIESGSITGIIGPNGAGKTTTFNTIAGVCRPSSGKIYFEGDRIDGRKPSFICKKGIARTFQVVRVFREITVYEHIVMGAVAGKSVFSSRSYNDEGITEILELTGFASVKDHLTGNLTSTRQKQLGLATALATNPKIILLDELMAGLNDKEIEECLSLLRKINEEMGITLIVIEHVMKAVMSLCEKIIVMDTGKVIAEGTPSEIANNELVINAYLGKEKPVCLS
ncbi:MAG: ABC transporter ATP-binding protein [Bacillota bacterium]|nr:ABC transporter ATP-binding protein [Bacillota bacterium]